MSLKIHIPTFYFSFHSEPTTENVFDDDNVATVQSEQHNEIRKPDFTASNINSSEKSPALNKNLQPSTSSQQQQTLFETTVESTDPPKFYLSRLRNRSKLPTSQKRQLIDFESDVSESDFQAGESETESKPTEPPLKKRLLSSKSKPQSQKAKADHQEQARNSKQKTNTRRKTKSVKGKPASKQSTNSKELEEPVVVEKSYDDSDKPNTLPPFEPVRNPGIYVDKNIQRDLQELDFFKLFFTDDLIEEIVKHTNTYAWIHINEKQSFAKDDGS